MVYNYGFRPGISNKAQLLKLGEESKIHDLVEKDVGGSSFDLHLGRYFWEMEGCVKPFAGKASIIDDICDKFGNRKDASKPEVLNKDSTYIFKIEESIDFNDTEFAAKATGRSSIGRLDILTRVIPKNHYEYDTIIRGCNTDIFLEITPLTFPVIVKKGTPMSQLRVSCCDFDVNEMRNVECSFLSENQHILVPGEQKVERDKLCTLKVNLDPDPKLPGRTVGFRAIRQEKTNRPPIDLTKDYKPGDDTNKYEPTLYWVPIEAQTKRGEKFIVIEPEEFYILRSKERFSLPPDVAVYCRAITEELGEIRIHYAGFVHPYFGAGNVDRHGNPLGTPLIFEVRSHNVDAILRHGDTLANIKYFRMSEKNEVDSIDYGKQELQLSKVFKDWPE